MPDTLLLIPYQPRSAQNHELPANRPKSGSDAANLIQNLYEQSQIVADWHAVVQFRGPPALRHQNRAPCLPAGYRPHPVRGTVLLRRATGHLLPDLRDPALTADRIDLAGR